MICSNGIWFSVPSPCQDASLSCSNECKHLWMTVKELFEKNMTYQVYEISHISQHLCAVCECDTVPSHISVSVSKLNYSKLDWIQCILATIHRLKIEEVIPSTNNSCPTCLWPAPWGKVFVFQILSQTAAKAPLRPSWMVAPSVLLRKPQNHTVWPEGHKRGHWCPAVSLTTLMFFLFE